jgi:Uma2 family endonuclease
METAHLISAEEYLHTTFEYDAEYVEGRIVYRPMPTKPHSKMQSYLIWALYGKGRTVGFEVWPSQRIRTRPNPARYRVPDVCVTFGEPEEDVFTAPPFLCIEILSPDDKAIEVREKVDEYLDFGVPYVWVIDPVTRLGEIHTRTGIEKIRDGKFKAGQIEIDLTQLQ